MMGFQSARNFAFILIMMIIAISGIYIGK